MVRWFVDHCIAEGDLVVRIEQIASAAAVNKNWDSDNILYFAHKTNPSVAAESNSPYAAADAPEVVFVELMTAKCSHWGSIVMNSEFDLANQMEVDGK